MKDKEIGAFEAKTRLSELLEEVRNGKEITITRRGKPVARLVPYRKRVNKLSKKELLGRFRQIRRSVKGKVSIRKYIEEGRKY